MAKRRSRARWRFAARSRPRASSTSSACPAGRSCRSTTRCGAASARSRCSSATSRWAATRRRVRARDGEGGRLLRHVRPRRDEPRHRDRRRVHGLGPARRDHRQRRDVAHRSDAFQEADITGITMPITKHNWLVTDVNDLPRILKEAFYVARTGRPARCSSTSRRTSRTPSSSSSTRDGRHPGLPPARPRGAAAQGRRAARPQRDPPRHLPRRRRPRLRRAQGGLRVRGARGRAGRDDGARQGRVPRDEPSVPRHVRHARLALRELRGAGLGSPHRARRQVRRPRHGQALHVRARGEDHPPRRRPGGDLEARHRHGPARRRSQAAPAAAHRGGPPRGGRAREARSHRVVAAHRRLAHEVPAQVRAGRAEVPPASVRGRDALEEDRWEGDRHDRRRRAPDVRGAVVEDLRAAPVHHLRRPRHDGLCLPRRSGRSSAARASSSSASTATARSR